MNSNSIRLGLSLFGTVLLLGACDSGYKVTTGGPVSAQLATTTLGTAGGSTSGTIVQPGTGGGSTGLGVGNTPGSDGSGSSGVGVSNSPSGDSGGHGTCSNNSNSTSDELVECELGAPSEKIEESGTTAIVAQNGNDSSDRICMSSNACLNLINAYAVARGCSLALGAATTPNATGQCTMIFPGSQGTCNNASVVSDADIASILLKMGG